MENGRIAAPHPRHADGPAPLDLSGHWVVPGFVDIHVHGGGGASFSSGQVDEALTVIATHREHGTTTMLASTVTGELDELARQAGVLSELVRAGRAGRHPLRGPVHLAAAAAARTSRRCCATPAPADVRKLVDAARGTARMVTLAPELPGGLESVRLLAEHGVIAAIGHTDGDYRTTHAGHRRRRHRRHPPVQRDAGRSTTATPARSSRCWRTSGSPSS